MANIANIKAGPRKVEIMHPVTAEPVGIRVTLVPLDDPRMSKIKRAIQDERMRREQRGKILKAEEIEENNDNVFYTAMLDWEWYNPTQDAGDDVVFDADAMPDFNGEQPEFNQRNVKAVLAELTWFRDQIDTALGDEKAFFTNSKRN